MDACYQTLPAGYFRLLTFANETDLVLDISPHALNSAPPYIALSYTWGRASYQKGRPSTLKYTVTIHGREVRVDQNLHDALRHLGHRVRKRGYAFWVDALCINQANNNERSAQVKMMKDIYERAELVYAWLGLPYNEEETKLAVDLMRRFYDFLDDGLQQCADDIELVLAGVAEGNEWWPGPDDETSDVWKAWEGLAEMFNQRYFYRTWIYQEATVPEKQILFWCGDHVFDGICLNAAVILAMTLSKIPGSALRVIKVLNQADSAARLGRARIDRRKTAKFGGQRLIDLLVQARLTTCTDLRDKVYAMVGHACNINGEIVVDYGKSLAEVYIDVARFLLTRYNALEGLGLVFLPAPDAKHECFNIDFPDESMPSWVPDWRQRVVVTRFVDSSRATESGRPLYDVGQGSQVEARVCGNELEIMGFLSTETSDHSVEVLTSIWDDAAAFPQVPQAWHAELMEACDQRDKPDLDQAIRRSLVGDRIRAVRSTGKNGSTSMWKRGGMADFDLLDKQRKDLDAETLIQAEEMMWVTIETCCGRRMGRLQGGQIATLPAAARKGDQIAAFVGGGCLYLVRRLTNMEKEAYTFVGECYVDGMMDGAFVQAGETARMLTLV